MWTGSRNRAKAVQGGGGGRKGEHEEGAGQGGRESRSGEQRKEAGREGPGEGERQEEDRCEEIQAAMWSTMESSASKSPAHSPGLPVACLPCE